MKTIEDAKKESTISIMKYKVDNALLFPLQNLKGFTIRDINKSFDNGIEFAQRWIPVEEEMPEKEHLNELILLCSKCHQIEHKK